MKDEDKDLTPNSREGGRDGDYQLTMLGDGGNRTGIGRRAWIVIAVLAIAIAAAAYWAFKPKKAAAPEEDQGAAVVSVQVAKAERQPIAAEVTALGTVFPHR